MMSKSLNIFFFGLDDDRDLLELMEDLIKKIGIENYKLFTSYKHFIEEMTDGIHVCVIDHLLGAGMTGIDICNEIKRRNADSYVIVMTGQRNFDVVVEYLNSCASKYIDKNRRDYLELFEKYVTMGLETAKKRLEEIEILEQKREEIRERRKLYE